MHRLSERTESSFRRKLGREPTISLEIVPPRISDERNIRLERARFKQELNEINIGIRNGTIDGYTIVSPPQFSPLERAGLQIVRRLLMLSSDPRARGAAAAIKTVRQFDLSRPQNLPPGFFPTEALQTRPRSRVFHGINNLPGNADAIFVVSGGDPRRKIAQFATSHYPGLSALFCSSLPALFSEPVDVRSVLRSIDKLKRNGRLPSELMVLGAWDHQHEPSSINSGSGEVLNHLRAKVEAGLQGVITQPAFDASHFERCLDRLVATEWGRQLQVKIGVPYLKSSRHLEYWCSLTGIDLRINPAVRELHEDLQRAERDGRIDKFAYEWSANQLDGEMHRPHSAGVHVMASKVEDGLELIKRVVGSRPTHTIVVNGQSGHAQFHRLARQLAGLQHPVKLAFDWIHASSEETPGKRNGSPLPKYIEHASPLLDIIYEEVRALQNEFRGTDGERFFDGLKIELCRISSRFGARAPIELISGEGLREVSINLRAFLRRGEDGHPVADPESLRTALDTALKRFISGSLVAEDVIFLDDSPTDQINSGLIKLGEDGYRLMREQLKLSTQPESALASTATKEPAIRLQVEEVIETLKRIGDDSRDIFYLEPGVYNANGIPEFIAALRKRCVECGLEEKFSRLKFVLSDFSQEALDSAREALTARCQEELTRIELLQLDATQDPLETYKQKGMVGRVVGAKSVNLLDAVGTNLLAVRDGKLYSVKVQTKISVRRLNEIASCFKNASSDISADSLFEFLKDARAGNFKDIGIPAALYNTFKLNNGDALNLWGQLFTSLEQLQTLQPIEDLACYPLPETLNGTPASEVLGEVARSFPGDTLFPDSILALRIIRGILPTLHPEASLVATQLTTTLPALNRNQQGLRQLGVTIANPLLGEIFEGWVRAGGYTVRTVPGPEIGASNLSTMYVVRR